MIGSMLVGLGWILITLLIIVTLMVATISSFMSDETAVGIMLLVILLAILAIVVGTVLKTLGI